MCNGQHYMILFITTSILHKQIKFKITTKVEGEGGTIEGDEIVKYGEDSSKDKIKIKAKGLLAQAICHELDHLDGVLFIDKMIPGTLQYVEPKNEE